MAVPEVIVLRSGAVTAGLAPACGGAITELTVGTEPVLRPHDPDRLRRDGALGAACFAMVPFASRVAEGRALFRGRRLEFGRNALPDTHACLGTTWQRSWNVLRADAASVELEVVVRDYALPFRCVQRVGVHSRGMTVSLEIESLAEVSIPVGCGLHPYFVAPEGATLSAQCSLERTLDSGFLPVETVPSPDRVSIGSVLQLVELGSAREFAGWSGSAELRWTRPDLRLRLDTRPPCSHLLTWLTPDRRFLCVEPMTHGTDAINRHERTGSLDGLQELMPGGVLRQQFTLSIESPGLAGTSGSP